MIYGKSLFLVYISTKLAHAAQMCHGGLQGDCQEATGEGVLE
jgi:hypothetical protein